MGRVKAARLIHAPIEAVWHTLNDIEHTPEWVVGLKAAEVKTPGNYGRGRLYYDYNQLGPIPQVTPWHVAIFEPMSRQVHISLSRTLPTTMTLKLTPVSGGTYLQMLVEYRFMPQLGMFSELLENLLMNRLLTQVIRQNQMNLQHRLESTTNFAPITVTR